MNDGTFDSYLTPATLFDGLYRPDCDRDRADGNPWLENKWWMKTTGRYPTIPLVYDLLDDTAKKLQVVKVSEYGKRWPDIAARWKNSTNCSHRNTLVTFMQPMRKILG